MLRRTLVAGVGLVVLALVTVLGVGFVTRWWTGTATLTFPTPSTGCVATVNNTVASLDLDQSYYAAIIAGVAVQRGLPPRAVSIAFATALQESDLHNINYGDRDSVGLFQQRPSQGWGTVEQIMNPQYSAGKFYDALVRISNWQTRDIGEVAQAVQRSAVPTGYDKHVDRARILASAMAGETAAALTCIGTSGKPADPTGFASVLSATYGGTATGTQVAGPPARVDVTVAADSTLWAVAAASQAWAAAYGVTQVTANDKVWHPGTNDLPLWASTSPATGRTVSVSFG